LSEIGRGRAIGSRDNLSWNFATQAGMQVSCR
jgi:hypothetical protein